VILLVRLLTILAEIYLKSQDKADNERLVTAIDDAKAARTRAEAIAAAKGLRDALR